MTASNLSREAKLQELITSLRPGQQDLAYWNGGQMAISAVPGAGKSHSLSVAAALAVARYQLHARRQLVVVTFTRSAAVSIKTKIRDRLKSLLLSQDGFIVHTLHGLALHIASRHPQLSELNLDTATLVVPNPSHRAIRTAVEQWIASNGDRYRILLEGREFDGEETERLRRQSVLRTEVLPNLAHTVIREAKSSDLSPEDLWELSQHARDEYQILAVAAGLYEQYQKLMRSFNFIDYDDLILAALRVLKHQPIRELWQSQIFAVFEDEAQDSSPLQEKLISLLAIDPTNSHSAPNLVRVGDPNQAINSTFTPANPVYFNLFFEDCQTKGRFATMDRAGRSSKIIIDAANFILAWVNEREKPEVFHQQDICPVDPDDPQQDANPTPVGRGLELYAPADIYQSVELIGKRVIELLKENPEANAAILVRENRQGRFVWEQLAYLLRENQIQVYEVGEVDRYSQIPAEILKLMQFIDRPHSPDYLKAALEVLQERDLIATQDLNALATYPEQFLYPTPLDPPQKTQVEQARRYCCNLLRARLELPHYQLISFLGMTLKYTGAQLATVQKLSERIDRQILGRSSLKNTIAALTEIVTSERFEAVEEESDNRYTKQGQVTIITMHKAKGLDWDYVFIPFLHEDILPGKPWVPTAAKFLGDFTVAEVARAQIRTVVRDRYLQPNALPNISQPIEAWQEAERLKRAEEFRLLYVAMTRAKRLLWMSAEQKGPFRWNTFRGDRGEKIQEKKPSGVIPALRSRFPGSIVE